jgi:hypothetical protein
LNSRLYLHVCKKGRTEHVVFTFKIPKIFFLTAEAPKAEGQMTLKGKVTSLPHRSTLEKPVLERVSTMAET